MLPLRDQLGAILPFCLLSFCGPVADKTPPPRFNSVAVFKVLCFWGGGGALFLPLASRPRIIRVGKNHFAQSETIPASV